MKIDNFNNNFRKFNLEQKKVLVAVSTGVDSMSLLKLLMDLPVKSRPQIEVAYVDHKLRKQSIVETEFIQKFCKKNNLKLHQTVWQKKFHPKLGIEEQARNFRYSFFEKVMDENNIKYLMTAHHADDQAETFLMKLVRGGQLQQLVGIESLRDFADNKYIIRPLLPFSKLEILNFAQRNQIKYFEDETNAMDDALRNRIRHQIIPLLKKENPKFLEHIQEYESQIKIALSCQELEQQRIVEKLRDSDGYNLELFSQLNANQQELVMKQILKLTDIPINQHQVTEIIQFLLNLNKPQGIYQINQEKQLRKEYQTFKIECKNKKTIKKELAILLSLNQWIKYEDFKIGIFSKDKVVIEKTDKTIGLSNCPSKLVLRFRKPKDYFEINGMHKKLRRYFIDNKIPSEDRQTMPLIADGNLIYAALNPQQLYLSHFSENATIRYIIVIKKYRKR